MRAPGLAMLACVLAVVLGAAACVRGAAGAQRGLPETAVDLTITFSGDGAGQVADAMDQPFVSGSARVGTETGRYSGILAPGTTYLPLSRCYYCFSASGTLTITTPSGTLTADVDPTRSTMSLGGGANKSAGYLLVLELRPSKYAGKIYQGTLRGYYDRNPATLVYDDAGRPAYETVPDSGQVGGPLSGVLSRALERLDQLLRVARD
jgi:hypothetical protein